MKKILAWHKDYFQTEFHAGVFLFSASVVACCLVLNYRFGLDARYAAGIASPLGKIAAHVAFFGLPWGLILLASLWPARDFGVLRNPEFLRMAAVALLVISVNKWFPFYEQLSYAWFNPEARYFGRKLLWNVKNSLIFIPPLAAWWFLVERQKTPYLYGVTTKGFSLRPYVVMLAALFPLIVWASFQPDFQAQYPQYRPGAAETYWGVPWWLTTGAFELVYGLDFFSVEFFFRGFLVIGMARFLGKKAILPMVGMYCVLHFGKPMGEALSSIVGGFVLGIIACYGRSILGGVLLHMGVAWTMEAAAIWHLTN